MPDPESLSDAHDLSSLLFRVAERVRADFAEIAAEFELSAVQARAVLLLEEPRSMKEMAAHLSCDASNVTGVADRLAGRGLLQRQPGRDRRVTLLALTSTGSELRAGLARRVADGSTVTARLDGAERAALRPLLVRLLDAEA